MEAKLEFIVESSMVNDKGRFDQVALWEVFEQGREHWYQQIGLSLDTLYQRGLQMEVEYNEIHCHPLKTPFLGETCILTTRPVKKGSSFFVLEQQIMDDHGTQYVHAKFSMLTVSSESLEIESLPEPIQSALAVI